MYGIFVLAIVIAAIQHLRFGGMVNLVISVLSPISAETHPRLILEFSPGKVSICWNPWKGMFYSTSLIKAEFSRASPANHTKPLCYSFSQANVFGQENVGPETKIKAMHFLAHIGD